MILNMEDIVLSDVAVWNEEDDIWKDEGDKFWAAGEFFLIQSVLRFTIDGFVKEEQNITTVLNLIRMFHFSYEYDDKNTDLDIFVDLFAEKYGQNHIGVKQYREFRFKSCGKPAMSIVISALVQLTPFKGKDITYLVEQKDVQMDRWTMAQIKKLIAVKKERYLVEKKNDENLFLNNFDIFLI